MTIFGKEMRGGLQQEIKLEHHRGTPDDPIQWRYLTSKPPGDIPIYYAVLQPYAVIIAVSNGATKIEVRRLYGEEINIELGGFVRWERDPVDPQDLATQQ